MCINLHLYFNPDKKADDGKNFARKLDKLRAEILDGHRTAEHENEYKKYFIIKETPKRGITLTVNQDAVDKARERYGFFSLISNDVRILSQRSASIA